nr:hypothetical protein [Tessaracoccus bendigoensis]
MLGLGVTVEQDFTGRLLAGGLGLAARLHTLDEYGSHSAELAF